jgi:hypothetical protein
VGLVCLLTPSIKVDCKMVSASRSSPVM